MIIKMNKNNKAFNAEGQEVTNFDNDTVTKIEFKLPDGSVLEIPQDKIESMSGGYLKTVYDGVDYIFDDGNRFESILLGYLVYKDYDTKNITDKDEGMNLRQELYSYVMDSCEFVTNMKLVNKDGIDYIICIDKINTIVSKNQQRKEECRKVFPFIKSMDKYCTFYVSIFSKCRDEIQTKIDSSSIIEKYLSKLGDEWKFVPKDYTRIPLHM